MPCSYRHTALPIEISLTIDVNVEFESDVAIQARKNHAIGYRSSSNLRAFDRPEPSVYFIEYVHRGSVGRDESER